MILVESATEAHKTFPIFHLGRPLYVTWVLLPQKLPFVAIQRSRLHNAPDRVCSLTPQMKGLERKLQLPVAGGLFPK